MRLLRASERGVQGLYSRNTRFCDLVDGIVAGKSRDSETGVWHRDCSVQLERCDLRSKLESEYVRVKRLKTSYQNVQHDQR